MENEKRGCHIKPKLYAHPTPTPPTSRKPHGVSPGSRKVWLNWMASLCGGNPHSCLLCQGLWVRPEGDGAESHRQFVKCHGQRVCSSYVFLNSPFLSSSWFVLCSLVFDLPHTKLFERNYTNDSLVRNKVRMRSITKIIALVITHVGTCVLLNGPKETTRLLKSPNLTQIDPSFPMCPFSLFLLFSKGPETSPLEYVGYHFPLCHHFFSGLLFRY